MPCQVHILPQSGSFENLPLPEVVELPGAEPVVKEARRSSPKRDLDGGTTVSHSLMSPTPEKPDTTAESQGSPNHGVADPSP